MREAVGEDPRRGGAGRRGGPALRHRPAALILLSVFLPVLSASPSALLAQTPAPPPAAPAKQVAAKKPAPPKKPRDPFTGAQRRELERLLAEARASLAEERKEVEAALEKLRAERAALEAEKAAVAAERAGIESRAAKIEVLAREVEEQKIRLDALVQSIPPSLQPSQELAERLAKLEERTNQKPELPPEAVSAGDFPGSIRIPGTSTAIKFGGSVWVSAVSTRDALGSDDRFLTWTIPVTGDPGAEKGPRTSFWANPSRLNFDVRTKTAGKRAVRAFIEGDFAGSSNGFRLRHAYVQFGELLAGQTWSTFSDPDADPGDLDFEGVNAENVQRQAQFRLSYRFSPTFRAAAAIEYPNSSLTDVDGSFVKGVNQVPDLVLRGTWTPTSSVRLQTAAVFRDVRGESKSRPDEIQNASGWGLSASGTLSALPWAPKDSLTFQVNGGRGIARFINDLNSAEGQDGAFEPATGDLRLFSHWGWYASYLHRWRGRADEPGDLRSSLVWGAVHVDNLDFLGPNAYRRTNRFGLNLVWVPIRGGELGLQYIWGERFNKDGASGDARQIQVRTRYLF